MSVRPGDLRCCASCAAPATIRNAGILSAMSRAGGIDIQILGIGTNGHIGFHEATSSLASRTRIKTLTAQTRTDNSHFFAGPAEVPTHCTTQGLGTILEAIRLLLVAQRERKARAIAAAVEGPVSSMCPASVLQLRPGATVIVDEDPPAISFSRTTAVMPSITNQQSRFSYPGG